MTDDELVNRFNTIASKADANSARIESLSQMLEARTQRFVAIEESIGKVTTMLDAHNQVVATERDAYRPYITKVDETWDWKNKMNGSLTIIRWALMFIGGSTLFEIILLIGRH